MQVSSSKTYMQSKRQKVKCKSPSLVISCNLCVYSPAYLLKYEESSSSYITTTLPAFPINNVSCAYLFAINSQRQKHKRNNTHTYTLQVFIILKYNE